MLAAGPAAVPLISEAMDAGWQGDQAGARLRRAARRHLLQHAQDDDLRRHRTRCSATSSRRRCSAEHVARMDFDSPTTRNAARRRCAALGRARATTSSAARAIVKAGGFSRDGLAGDSPTSASAGLQVPEAHGGLGFGAVEAMVVMEELGRGLVIEPFAAVALVATGAADGRPRRRRPRRGCSSIAEGKELVVLAHEERALALPPRATSRPPRTAAGDAWRLDRHQDRRAGRRRGRRLHRPGARQRRASTTPAGIGLFLVSTGEPRRRRARLPDAGRRERRRPGRSTAPPAIELRRARRGLAGARARRSTSASPRSAPRPSARWTSWSRSRSST